MRVLKFFTSEFSKIAKNHCYCFTITLRNRKHRVTVLDFEENEEEEISFSLLRLIELFTGSNFQRVYFSTTLLKV